MNSYPTKSQDDFALRQPIGQRYRRVEHLVTLIRVHHVVRCAFCLGHSELLFLALWNVCDLKEFLLLHWLVYIVTDEDITITQVVSCKKISKV
jgi:hypothetical protein